VKYIFEIRSRAVESEPIAQKHTAFLAGLRDLPAPWAVTGSVPAPDPGRELVAVLKVSKFLGPGIRGNLVYQFRRPFRDEGSEDDWINISFNPEKLDYATLVRDVFLKYVVAFRGYYAEILDEEFIFKDYEVHRTLKLNQRRDVFRIAPVTFIDDELCRRAFGFGPDEVVSRLQGHAESVTRTVNGVFIVLTSKVLSFDEADTLTRNARALLGPHPGWDLIS